MLDIAIVTCLALNIYHEARGEPIDAQMLIAEVTINRAVERGETICEVVWDKNQFSWTSDKLSDRPKDIQAYTQSTMLAVQALSNPSSLLGSGANHYHEASIKPFWAKNMTLLGQYGNHIFYTDKL